MYKKATLFFSQDSASVASVIPAMDKLDTHLNPGTQKSYHHAIQAAMKLARKKINRYYSITDLSSVYRIAMSKYNTNLWSSCLSSISPPSRAQTRILSTKGMGRRVDRQRGSSRLQSIYYSI